MTTPNNNQTAAAMPGCAHTTCSRLRDTPRTDAVLNTFDGKASKLAADLATHAEELERECDAARSRVQEARDYRELCKKSYGPHPTTYQSGVLLGLEIAINFASENAPDDESPRNEA